MNVTFENESESYLTYAKALRSILEAEEFKKFANDHLQQILIASNARLVKDIELGNQVSVRILAS